MVCGMQLSNVIASLMASEAMAMTSLVARLVLLQSSAAFGRAAPVTCTALSPLHSPVLVNLFLSFLTPSNGVEH
jgi:hypothetical protein